jgi:hypothetical protein
MQLPGPQRGAASAKSPGILRQKVASSGNCADRTISHRGGQRQLKMAAPDGAVGRANTAHIGVIHDAGDRTVAVSGELPLDIGASRNTRVRPADIAGCGRISRCRLSHDGSRPNVAKIVGIRFMLPSVYGRTRGLPT